MRSFQLQIWLGRRLTTVGRAWLAFCTLAIFAAATQVASPLGAVADPRHGCRDRRFRLGNFRGRLLDIRSVRVRFDKGRRRGAAEERASRAMR